MNWFSVLIGALGAFIAGAPVWGPVLYKFLKGRRDLGRQDRLDLLSAHESFGAAMQERLNGLRVRLDEAENTIRLLEREAGECQASKAALAAELAELKGRQT